MFEYYNVDGIVRLLKRAKEYDYRLYGFLYVGFVHGLVYSELRRIRVEDVDLAVGRVTLKRGGKMNTGNAIMSDEEVEIFSNIQPVEGYYFSYWTEYRVKLAMKELLRNREGVQSHFKHVVPLKASYINLLLWLGCGSRIAQKMAGFKYKESMGRYMKLFSYNKDEVLLEFNKQIYKEKTIVEELYFLNRRELTAIFRKTRKGDFFAALYTAFINGLTINELLQINCDDVDFEERTIRLSRKSGVFVEKLDKISIVILKEEIKKAVGDKIFGRFSEEELMEIILKLSEEIGFPEEKISSEMFRTAYAIQLLNSGYDISEVGMKLGITEEEKLEEYLVNYSYQFDFWQMLLTKLIDMKMKNKSGRVFRISKSNLINDIRGRCGAVVYTSYKDTRYVKQQALVHYDRNSEEQQQMRETMSSLRRTWKKLEPKLQVMWEAYAAKTRNKKYHSTRRLMIREKCGYTGGGAAFMGINLRKRCCDMPISYMPPNESVIGPIKFEKVKGDKKGSVGVRLVFMKGTCIAGYVVRLYLKAMFSDGIAYPALYYKIREEDINPQDETVLEFWFDKIKVKKGEEYVEVVMAEFEGKTVKAQCDVISSSGEKSIGSNVVKIEIELRKK